MSQGLGSNNYNYVGIGHVEAQDRCDEYRTGVPSQGDGQAILTAPAPGARQILSKVHAHNVSEVAALLRMVHQGSVKTVTAEILSNLAVAGNRFTGKLQYGAITPGSMVITEAGALADVVDDGSGVLHDTGIPANVRGTVNYTTGLVDWTYGGAATAPVTAAYTHTDFTNFQSTVQTQTATAAASYPESFSTSIGRVVPGTVTLTDGALTLVDDGKGNMIETTGGIATVVGTVDYAIGLISLTSGSGALNGGANAVTITSRYNPFASLLAAGSGQALADLFNGQLPELTQEPWADGLKGESLIGMWGESRSNAQANLITMWYHASEDPFRVEAPFSGFPAGGHDNDPRL